MDGKNNLRMNNILSSDSLSNGDRTVTVDVDPYEDMAHETPILIQYWQAVLRHKIAIAIIVAACIALGILTTLLTTPYYTSTAMVEISREQDEVPNVEGVTSSDIVGQNLEFFQTHYSLLVSRSLAERVVRARHLSANDSFFVAIDVDPDNSGLLDGDSK